jgi:hypothetical protein
MPTEVDKIADPKTAVSGRRGGEDPNVRLLGEITRYLSTALVSREEQTEDEDRQLLCADNDEPLDDRGEIRAAKEQYLVASYKSFTAARRRAIRIFEADMA